MSEPIWAEEERVLTDEEREYVESFGASSLSRFGIGYSEEEALEWLEADVTVDDAMEWINRGCGPGDASGWTELRGGVPG